MQPTVSTYEYLTTTAFRLFPQHLLVSTHLIRLPPALIPLENQRLHEQERALQRPKKRHGLYLDPIEPFALLVADMSPTPLHPTKPETRQVLVEFKPKWVVQSPSAPPASTRCRTCALRLQKSLHGGKTLHGFCPLDLSSGLRPRVERAVSFLIPSAPPANLLLSSEKTWEFEREVLREKVVGFLLSSKLMPAMRALQVRLDPLGPLRNEMGREFLNAMTVRDLTVFLRVDLDGGVETGIGDLDMKTAEAGKGEYWRETERALVEEGWYEGKEEGGAGRGVRCEL
jgi:inositol-pentakisphosphate 2-kinase